MSKKTWEEQLSQIEKGLGEAGIKGCFDETENAVVRLDIKLGRIHCRGCWKIIPGFFSAKNRRYCKECMSTRNNLEDYQMIFREVTGWMENFIKLKDYYQIRMNWNQSSISGDPAQVKKGILTKRYILARTRVRRDAIPKFLVYSYMILWMSEKDQNNRFYKELCNEFLRNKNISDDSDNSEVIAYWYMMQYMYAKGEIGEAEKGKVLMQKKPRDRLEKLIKEYPLWKPNNQSDDREDLEALLCKHPLNDILGM